MRYFNSIVINGNAMFEFALEYFGWDNEARARQEADKYEFRVLELICKINATKTGAAVLRAVERSSSNNIFSEQRIMTIVPRVNAPLKDLKPGDKNYDTKDPYNNSAVNASAVPKDRAAATPKEKIYEGDRFGKGYDAPQRGTGAGTNTTIDFTPQHFISNDINPILGIVNPSDGFEPDEFLLHEIVHGLRHLAGLSFQRAMKFPKGYKNTEEYLAVLIANIYRSECRKTGLRESYDPPIFTNMSEADFMRQGMQRTHLRQLRREHHLLFFELRKIDVAFNPTRRILDI